MKNLRKKSRETVPFHGASIDIYAQQTVMLYVYVGIGIVQRKLGGVTRRSLHFSEDKPL